MSSHGIKKYTFGVSSAYNKALRRNLAKSLIAHEQIMTTLAKAKALRPFVEKLVTSARKGSIASRRNIVSTLGSDCPEAKKLCSDLAKRYQGRPGGYLRIMKSGFRKGDKSPMAVIEFVDRDINAKGLSDREYMLNKNANDSSSA